jgi:hypothetical protein
MVVRKAITWLTLILFGTVSLMGHGLHVLVGCDPITHATLAGQQQATCCGCLHGCAPAGDGDETTGRLIAGHEDDCPICRFLAQGRELTKPVLVLCARFVRPQIAALPSLSPPLPCDEPYQARAPPAIS